MLVEDRHLWLLPVQYVTPLSGGYSGGVPPLPIPNREVKPVIADGTAMQCGRVGSRLLSVERFPEREVSPFFMSLLTKNMMPPEVLHLGGIVFM